jgi:glucosamine 6-phosphate synthetase-like amidotransferase/phosphosugar isomerase protein
VSCIHRNVQERAQLQPCCALLLLLQGDRYRIRLGGLVETRDIIRRSRRIMFVACGTSYHASLAARQTVRLCSALASTHAAAVPSACPCMLDHIDLLMFANWW